MYSNMPSDPGVIISIVIMLLQNELLSQKHNNIDMILVSLVQCVCTSDAPSVLAYFYKVIVA